MNEGAGGDVTLERVLAAFDERTPGEPLTSTEVAATVGCSRRTAYNRLETLESGGEIRTKKVGARSRVWWREPSAGSAATRLPADGEGRPERLLEVEFRSPSLSEAFAELSASEPVRFDVEHELPLPDGRRLQYYTIKGVPPRPFAEAFERLPSMESVRLLSTVGEVSRVEGIVEPHSVAEVLRHHGGETKSAGVRDGEHWVIAELPATADTAAVAREVREVYPDMRLASTRYVPTVHDFWAVVESELTERQLTVLQLAYYAGYFERPRLNSGVELADRLDITRQTFNHHLREAERTVLDRLFRGAAPNSDE